jgi:hypothetical protein
LYQDDNNKEFVFENDTIRINYSFAGENLPLTITLYNKLLQPIYIDLGRSPVVINNSQINESFYSDGQISFIAPLSYLTLSGKHLRDHFIDLNLKDQPNNETLATNLGINHSFNERTTPLYFRSILALTTNEDYTYPVFFDYSFWISDVLPTMARPSSVSSQKSNQFYIRKTTGFGKFVRGIILAYGES